MTLIEALRAFLLATPAVADLVGANVFPTEAAQSAGTPRIVLKRSSEVDDQTLDKGAVKQPTCRGEVLCYGGKTGPGYTTAREVADAVLYADGGEGGRTLAGFFGSLASLKVGYCRFEDDADETEQAADAGGRGEQSVQLQFVISYVKQ